MFGWSRKSSEAGLEPPGILQQLHQLETRVARLELDHAERQVAVLNTLEKVTHQLTTREAKRVRDRAKNSDEEVPLDDASVADVPREPRRPSVDTSHLSRRFRVGGG